MTDRHADWEEAKHIANSYADTYGQFKRLGLGLKHLPNEFSRMRPCLEQYEREWMYKRGFLDPESRIIQASEVLATLHSLNVQEIVIDGFVDLSPLQYKLLEGLVRFGLPVTFYLPQLAGDTILQQTQAHLERLGFTVESEGAPLSPRLRKQQVVQATTMQEEIYGVLDWLADIAKDEGYEQAAVVLIQEEPYREELLQIAGQLKIPVKLPKTTRLSDTLLIRFLRRWLNADFCSAGKWEQAGRFDDTVSMLFPSPALYMEWKNRLLSGQARLPDLHPAIAGCWEARRAFPEEGHLVDYVDRILALLEAMNLPSVWKKRLEEADTGLGLKIALEWRALHLLQHLLQSKKEQWQRWGEDHPFFHAAIFADWLSDMLDGQEIFQERAPARGISVFTLRDVALFQGKTLFVLGMNEGQFPQAHRLLGYFRESHLDGLPIPFSKPDAETFNKKQEVLFRQLAYLAEHLVFSYVAGTDQAHPLLPSPYIGKYRKIKLEPWRRTLLFRYSVKRQQIKRYKKKKGLYHRIPRFSTHGRLTKRAGEEFVYHSLADRAEKWAYHAGMGLHVPGMPEHLQHMKASLERLETGQEPVRLPSWRERQEARLRKVDITELEAYAACPFRYLMGRALQVAEPLREQSLLDRRITGTMFHRLMEKFYRSLGLIGQPFSRYREQQMQETAEKTLWDLFEQEWTVVEQGHSELPVIQLKWEKESWRKAIEKWWLAERKCFWEREELSAMRIHSLEEKLVITLEVAGRTIELHGKCDRVDRDEQGFAVYDYKTGQASMRMEEEVAKGLKLQIPLYLYGLEAKIGRAERLEPYGGTYVSLYSPASRASNGLWLDSPEQLKRFGIHHKANKLASLKGAELLSGLGLEQTISALWTGMLADYSVKPLRCSRYCPYKMVCRVTEEQIEKAGEA